MHAKFQCHGRMRKQKHGTVHDISLCLYNKFGGFFCWRKIKHSFLQIRLPLEKWMNQNKLNGISNCYGMFDIESILFGMQIVYGDTIEYINVIVHKRWVSRLGLRCDLVRINFNIIYTDLYTHAISLNLN